jgi:hypothetical protein
MKKARVVMTRAWVIKAVAERLGANEGGREEEENGSEIAALVSERLRDLNSGLRVLFVERCSGCHCVA